MKFSFELYSAVPPHAIDPALLHQHNTFQVNYNTLCSPLSALLLSSTASKCPGNRRKLQTLDFKISDFFSTVRFVRTLKISNFTISFSYSLNIVQDAADSVRDWHSLSTVLKSCCIADSVVIILVIITMFRRLATKLGLVEPPELPKYVTVKLAGRSFRVEFEPQDSPDPPKGVTVGFLREQVAEVAKVGADRIILADGDRKLTDDSAYLANNGIKSGELIMAFIASDRLARKGYKKSDGATPTPPPKPRTPREKVQDVLDVVEKDLQAPIEAFISSPPAKKEEREEVHRRLSELVLQKMFLLDDVDVSEDPELRQFRREVINKLHKYHDDLDKTGSDKDENEDDSQSSS